MKKKLLGLLAIFAVALLCLALAGCGGRGEEPVEEEDQQTEQTETTEDEGPQVVKTIGEVDVEGSNDIPLQIESVSLLDDGSVMIVPLDDLKKNAESNNELKDGAIYPFADSGKARDIYLVRFGNGGYRTIIALMDDGTLSALSARELIEDHITVVMDAVSGRDGFVSVEQIEDENSFGVIGKTGDGDEVELDFSLNF